MAIGSAVRDNDNEGENMEKLKLQLEHCYGIRKLDVVLDFGGNADPR